MRDVSRFRCRLICVMTPGVISFLSWVAPGGEILAVAQVVMKFNLDIDLDKISMV